MWPPQISKKLLSVFICTGLYTEYLLAFEFQPGVEVAAVYTDNARLASDNKASDVVTIGEVEATVKENEGPLVYDAIATLRRESYVNDTYIDRRYFNLYATANWEVSRERLDIFVRDIYSQKPFDVLSPDTPDNRQDSNLFDLGANLYFPVSSAHTFTLTPKFSRNYFEVSLVSNRQYTLMANWNYHIYRLTDVGVILTAREVEYDDKSVSDTSYTSIDFFVSGERVNSRYNIILGATNVRRDASQEIDGSENSSEDTGFSGNINIQSELSSRSTLDAVVLTEITDTTKLTSTDAPGNPNVVQQATDVVRNSIGRLSYIRDDEVLNSLIYTEYRKIRYANLTELTRIIRSYGGKLQFPINQSTSSGVFVGYLDTELEESQRKDKELNVGTNVRVSFTRRLNSTVEVKYRTKESTDSSLNYDEFSASIALEYFF